MIIISFLKNAKNIISYKYLRKKNKNIRKRKRNSECAIVPTIHTKDIIFYFQSL